MVIALVAIIYSLFRGYHEGMVHIRPGEYMHYGGFQEGVRSHKLHKKHYHQISTGRDIAAAAVGVLLCLHGIDILLFAGLLLLCWEGVEIANNYARMAAPLMKITDTTIANHFDEYYENINFFDIYQKKLWGPQVISMHIIRITVGIMYLMGSVVL